MSRMLHGGGKRSVERQYQARLAVQTLTLTILMGSRMSFAVGKIIRIPVDNGLNRKGDRRGQCPSKCGLQPGSTNQLLLVVERKNLHQKVRQRCH